VECWRVAESSDEMNRISVIIVSWNARKFLQGCLESLRRVSRERLAEIIVVDNASTDDSPELVSECFPEVTLIRAKENLGFARANNLGIKHATGAYLALINSDVIVHADCLERLSDFLDNHPTIGLVGPRVVGGDGHLQITCRRLPTIWNYFCCVLGLDRLFARCPLFSGFEMRHWNYDLQGDVQVLSGCFWLARAAAVRKVGGLDEQFFFYAEDMDWCKRFLDAGWRVCYFPEAKATHFGGGSSSNAPLRYSIEMLRANLKYWQKHHGRLGQSAYFALALLYHSFRLVARAILRVLRLGSTTRHKLQEHLVCVRWLLTGKEV